MSCRSILCGEATNDKGTANDTAKKQAAIDCCIDAGPASLAVSTCAYLIALIIWRYRLTPYRLNSLTLGLTMKKLFVALMLTLPLIVTPVFAADGAPTAQQSKMGACAKENKGLKGDEYKAAQKACLQKSTDAQKAQRAKMKACSAENKGKKGAEFKAAQKECLSK